METAPLRNDLAEGPEGGRAVWAQCSDGVRIRAGGWTGGRKGTVLLFTGRTEYIEKYGRMARAVGESGLSLAAQDWRGQGMSDRVAANPNLGHVGHFSDYQLDVAAFIEAVEHLDFPKPWYLLGHSMGGAIGLRALLEGVEVTSAVFSSPMWGIAFPGWLDAISRPLTATYDLMGLSLLFAPGTGPTPYPFRQAFEGNELTSDPESYAWLRAHIRTDARFGIGGPSMAWMREALAEIRDFETVPDIPCHSLVLVGAEENIVSAPKIEELCRKWPNARFETLPESRHEAMMEKPEIRAEFTRRSVGHFLGA